MSDPQRRSKVIVIGAGLGGLSAAISLANQGFRVEVYEKNEKAGGKLNQMQLKGFRFDMGPSILTLVQYFRRLWEQAGKRMEDYVRVQTVRPHWRNVFEDGKVIDLYPEPERMAQEAIKVGGEKLKQQVERFLAYSKFQYHLSERGYFEAGLDTAADFGRFYDWRSLLQMDYWHSMHGSVRRFISNPYFVDIFDYFIKYVGSSAYRAPGFMNLMPNIQFEYDLWYAEGGMYQLAKGLQRLAEEQGVVFHFDQEVVHLDTQAKQVVGVRLKDGQRVSADVVVSNMEVIPAYERLLEESPAFLRSLRRFEPACSGLVIHLGTDRKYPMLAHHNFFFSRDQKKHFKLVFQQHRLPEDPTLYVVAPERSDPTVCPAGGDNIKVLPHIPYLNAQHPVSDAEYAALAGRVLEKLERMGLKDLRQHIVVEHLWTPKDIQAQYYSNQGSIYGVVSDRFKNFALKAPKRSSQYTNLYFVGGSVNPGGGMPMVVLGGQNVARMVAQEVKL